MPITNLIHVLNEYRSLGRYMTQTFGWKSGISFWATKLLVADEGGEYALLNPVFRNFPQSLKTPFKLEMEHTTICNKQCLLCEHTYWDEPNQRISFRQFRGIIDTIPGLKWINITGEGSGFLNRDFIPMLEYARKRHINVNFVDEFDFLEANIAKKVISLGINSIYISFDGATKTTYETIKKGCDFDRALDNIRRFCALKTEMKSPFPVLHFRFVVTKMNYREMPDFIRLISSLENRGLRGRIEFVGLLTFPEIESYYMPLDEVPESILIETFESALTCGVNLHFSHAQTRLPPMESCSAWTEPYILIGGEVVSCCAIIMSNNRKFLRENSFGNVYETPFPEIWNSDKYVRFRKQVNRPDGKVPKTCYQCRAYDTIARAGKYGVED